MTNHSKRLKIFTWHIHGSYLFYLAKGDYDIYIPTHSTKEEGYVGRGETFPFGQNVKEVSAAEVKNLTFDLILFQTNKNYLIDQYDILSEQQQQLPKIYLEHDPPRKHPTDTVHIVDDPSVQLVHVTGFNKLMWNNNNVSSLVIEHGVKVPDMVSYSGSIERGLVVINNLPTRGRLLGLDIFNEVKQQVPIDLIGMGTESLGLGEVLHPQLPQFVSQYRFFFNPIRYTSLGLAVIEAMMLGVPLVGLATTEMVTVIRNGENGFIHTDVDYLIEKMKLLLKDPELAAHIGSEGRKTVMERFNIDRFINDWTTLFYQVIQNQTYASMPAEVQIAK